MRPALRGSGVLTRPDVPCSWCGSKQGVIYYSYLEPADEKLLYPHLVHVVTELCLPCIDSYKVIQELSDPYPEHWQQELAEEITGELLLETMGGEQ